MIALLASMRHPAVVLWVVLLLLGAGRDARAQRHRLIPLSDPAYTYIQRLQRRGHLLELNPTALPYTQGNVVRALRQVDSTQLHTVAARWGQLLKKTLDPVSPTPDEAVAGGRLEGGARLTNNDRLDVLRTLDDDTRPVLPYAAVQAYLEKGPLIGHLGWRHDLYYDVDPDGLDAANRLYARSEQTYVGYNSALLSLYLGRFAPHWAPHGAPAVLISSNPRSYDLLALRLGTERLALRSLLGELDNISEGGTFTGKDFEPGSRRRYLAAHRIDWRPSPHVALSLMESTLYSGASAGPSLKYFNPLHPFFLLVDNRPKNDQNNGFLAGLLWAYVHNFTLHGQLLVDDFDVLNREEPASFALTGSVHYSGLSPVLDLGGTFAAVAARTYNTNQPEGKYLYLKRGLATEFNDYVRASLTADWYLDAVLPGLTVSPQLHLLAQGERAILDDYADIVHSADLILDGTVERTLRPALEVRFQSDPRWWVRLDLGVNLTDNADHVAGRRAAPFVGLLEAGARLSLDRAFRLPF